MQPRTQRKSQRKWKLKQNHLWWMETEYYQQGASSRGRGQERKSPCSLLTYLKCGDRQEPVFLEHRVLIGIYNCESVGKHLKVWSDVDQELNEAETALRSDVLVLVQMFCSVLNHLKTFSRSMQQTWQQNAAIIQSVWNKGVSISHGLKRGDFSWI